MRLHPRFYEPYYDTRIFIGFLSIMSAVFFLFLLEHYHSASVIMFVVVVAFPFFWFFLDNFLSKHGYYHKIDRIHSEYTNRREALKRLGITSINSYINKQKKDNNLKTLCEKLKTDQRERTDMLIEIREQLKTHNWYYKPSQGDALKKKEKHIENEMDIVWEIIRKAEITNINKKTIE